MTPYIVGGVIAQAVICGGLCVFLANQKGYNPNAWFFVGFLFGVLGLIACAGMPAVLEELPGISRHAVKRCPRCDELVRIKASVCRYCQHEFE